MKSWGGELNLDIKIDENLLLSDDELLPKNELESENSNDESKKDKDLDTNLADLSELVKDM